MTPRHPQELSLADVRALSRDEALVARAEQLWGRGAVERPTRRGRLLTGQLQGSDPAPYQITVEPHPDEGWRWHCTCPYFEIYGGPCKHALALLLEWAQRPERFAVEASLDERLAGPDRGRWLALLRDELHANPELRRLLDLPPERRRASPRPIPLEPFEDQIAYARERYAEEPAMQLRLLRGVLESAAGYLRVEDGANAARVATLLSERLLRWPRRRRPLDRLLHQSLLLLEAALLDATWSDAEQADWIARVQSWWPPEQVGLDDRLLDLLIHGARGADLPALEGWLRAQLRRPRQANRLSSAGWRRRVLDFLLARAEARGDQNRFLELCWEEGEDARAARWLVEREATGEALVLARQGLGSSGAHRAVAAALHEVGQGAEARRVAEDGLRYNDRGRGALLAWLAARALDDGDAQRARTLAEEAWAEAPSGERLALLRRAWLDQPEWATRREELDQRLAARGDEALRVELWTAEGAIERAAALLPTSGPQREPLTEELARAAAEDEPGRAVALLVDLAALRAAGRDRPAYARAASALLAARTLAEARGATAELEQEMERFWKQHGRLRALRDEVARLGLEEER